MAAVANVQLSVDARNAIQQLDRVKTATGGANKTFTDARGRLRGVNGQFVAMSRTAGTARKSINALGVTLSTYLAPLVALSAAVQAVSSSLQIMSEREADAKALANGLQGLTTDGTAALNSLQQSADQLGKATLFNEEDFTQGFKLLTSFRTIGVSSYEQVAGTAADMAQVLNQDVNSVLLQVAKALEAPEVGLTALQRSGTRFTDQQKQQVKAMVAAGDTAKAQAFILKELERQYGGAAKAAATGFAGAMDTLGEVTRDVLDQLGRLISPAVEKGIEGLIEYIEKLNKFWSAFAKVVLPEINKALQPVIQAFNQAFAQIPWAEVGNLIQNVILASFLGLAKILQTISPVIAYIIKNLVERLKQSPLGFIVQQAFKLAQALGLTKPIVDTLSSDTGKIKTNFKDIPPAIDAATEAQKRQKKELKESLDYINEQKNSIKEQAAAFESQLAVNSARLKAEQAINNLQGKVLERAYEQAGTAEQRLQIAKEIFNNTVRGAQIEYRQALASIEAEEQRLKFKLMSAEAEYKTIAARGQLAILEAKSTEEAEAKRKQLNGALSDQESAYRIYANQLGAQQKIAEYEKQAAKAQYEAKILAAQTAIEQKLVSEEIGLSKQEAITFSNKLASSVTSADNLATGTDRVADNARQASIMYIEVANQAGAAASQINAAAVAQERLNAARGAGGSGTVTGAADGAYWMGGFKAFADGGVVEKPTLGLVGEGGESEYIIPASKMDEAMSRYASGQRGSSVIPSSINPQVNVTTGPVMNMNGGNYVSQNDFMAGMQTASRRGAEMALQMLTSSPQARRMAGIG